MMNINYIETGYQPWWKKENKNTSITISKLMWKTLKIHGNGLNQLFPQNQNIPSLQKVLKQSMVKQLLIQN